MRNKRRSQRIDFEKPLVAKYFPGAQFHNCRRGTCLDFRTGRNGWRNDYQLRAELPPDYPDAVPGLFIESPRILPMFGGDGILNDMGRSHAWHTDVNDEDNRVKVCYTDDWDASMNCCVVLLRGLIYVAAYENHLTTGETIAEYIERLKNEIGDQ